MNVDILTRSTAVFGWFCILGSDFSVATIRNRLLCHCLLNDGLCELIDECKPINVLGDNQNIKIKAENGKFFEFLSGFIYQQKNNG